MTRLMSDFSEPVRDPLWKHIYLDRGLARITRTRAFRQLGRIRQLGPAFHVYPGAVHTRLNHSLGVYHITRRMILSLLGREHTHSRIGGLATYQGVMSLLAAALLHDIGHFPFAHSLKELPLTTHEALAAIAILSDDELKRAIEEAGADPEKVCGIIDTTAPTDDPEVRLYRTLLSGTLDPDKLDYLNRDAYFCGVPYGLQDVDFIIDQMRITPQMTPAISHQGIGAIEHLLFSKYLMYRNIYWHHSVRSATAMIKKALFAALSVGALRPEELYGHDDASLDEYCSAHQTEFPAFRLVEAVQERRLLQCVIEVPFDEQRRAHRDLLSLAERSIWESRIATVVKGAARMDKAEQDRLTDEVIIDIPERTSFESSVPVISDQGEVKDFIEAGPVFTPPVIEGFTNSLRQIRLFIPYRFGSSRTSVLHEFPEIWS